MYSTLKKVWHLFSKEEQRKTLTMLAMICLMALAETVGVISIMPFLSVLGRPEIINETPWLHKIYSTLEFSSIHKFIILLGLTSMALVIASSAFKTITLHVVTRFTHMIKHSLSSRLLSRYLNQPYEFHLTRNPSELSKNVLAEADQITFNLIQPLSMLIANGTVASAMLLLIVIYDPWMAICIFIGIGLLYGAIYLFVRRRLKQIGQLRQAADEGRYQSCNEALSGIKEVKITNSAAAWLDIYVKHSRAQSRYTSIAETLSTSPLYIVEAVGYSGLIIIAIFLLMKSNDAAQVLPALGLYGFAAYRLLPAAQIMYRGFARLQYSSATLEHIYSDLQLPETPSPKSTNILYPTHQVHLRNISYSYPSAKGKLILDGLNLSIPANCIIGITGKSGAGKSTLMDILLGLTPPETGEVTIDQTPITPANVHAWQRAIGYVPQNIYLADTSIAENIAFGVPPEKIDMIAVERAAIAAQIHDFITGDLPNGYLTQIGDRGIRLSGGQRQRIGIARALYNDPPVLCMDEATSALDSQTEKALTDAIKSLSKKKTIILIAHRQASLDACDFTFNIAPPTN